MAIAKTEKAPATDGTAAKLRGVCEKVEKIIKALENVLGVDIDRDGKVGGTKLVSLLVLLVASVMCFGATQWNQRDAADTYDTVNIGDDGSMALRSASATTTFTVSAAGVVDLGGAVSVGGDVTLENSEVIDNGTTAIIRLASDSTDTNTVPLTVELTSLQGTGYLDDGDEIRIAAQMNQSGGTNYTYNRIDFVASDVTLNTEDGGIQNMISINGALSNMLDIATDGVTCLTTLDAATLSAPIVLVNSRAPVVAASTTQVMIQYGTCTNGVAITFPTAFGSGVTPTVILEQQASTNNYVTGVASNAFTPVVGVSGLVGWTATGNR